MTLTFATFLTGLDGAAGFAGAAKAATLVISAKPSKAGIILFMITFLYFSFVFGWIRLGCFVVARRALSESHSKNIRADVEAT